jgi:hypothetical protein
MDRSLRLRKTACNVSDSLHHQLNTYALAATAAGVGVLALAQPVEAKIVYTPAHKHLGPHQSFPLDLNHDGTVDFKLTNFASCGTDQCHYSLTQKPATGNSAVGYNFDGELLLDSAFKPGHRIGPGGVFHKGTAELVYIVYSSGPQSTFVIGKWRNVQDRYLALKFKIKGRTHYGWARLNVQVNKTSISATLTGYAYETTPNTPIIAGQTEELSQEDLDTGAFRSSHTPEAPKPVSLGMLALGAQGVLLWRKEQEHT